MGTLFLAIPYRLLLLGWRNYQCLRHRASFGPPRPDELCTPERAMSGMLEIYCAQQKPWHERQVLEYADKFYLLESRHPVRRGANWSHCYRFRSMHPGEIVRGALVRYPWEGQSPASPRLPPPN